MWTCTRPAHTAFTGTVPSDFVFLNHPQNSGPHWFLDCFSDLNWWLPLFEAEHEEEALGTQGKNLPLGKKLLLLVPKMIIAYQFFIFFRIPSSILSFLIGSEMFKPTHSHICSPCSGSQPEQSLIGAEHIPSPPAQEWRSRQDIKWSSHYDHCPVISFWTGNKNPRANPSVIRVKKNRKNLNMVILHSFLVFKDVTEWVQFRWFNSHQPFSASKSGWVSQTGIVRKAFGKDLVNILLPPHSWLKIPLSHTLLWFIYSSELKMLFSNLTLLFLENRNDSFELFFFLPPLRFRVFHDNELEQSEVFYLSAFALLCGVQARNTFYFVLTLNHRNFCFNSCFGSALYSFFVCHFIGSKANKILLDDRLFIHR